MELMPVSYRENVQGRGPFINPPSPMPNRDRQEAAFAPSLSILAIEIEMSTLVLATLRLTSFVLQPTLMGSDWKLAPVLSTMADTKGQE